MKQNRMILISIRNDQHVLGYRSFKVNSPFGEYVLNLVATLIIKSQFLHISSTKETFKQFDNVSPVVWRYDVFHFI